MVQDSENRGNEFLQPFVRCEPPNCPAKAIPATRQDELSEYVLVTSAMLELRAQGDGGPSSPLTPNALHHQRPRKQGRDFNRRREMLKACGASKLFDGI